MAKVLKAKGYKVIATDLINRGYEDTKELDFLKSDFKDFDGDIITNPPYKYATEFIYKAMETVQDGHKVAMFLRLQFLEGKARRKLFEKYPPKVVYVSSSRLKCAKGGDFEHMTGSASAYAWFVWEKGFKGDPIIKWIN